ncbi:cyclic nucleotide-binding domain protein (macronuclear) [Tetrahymena thermophila SB210]|uniref:Cyclic nucleotide-binding domain protein n=1 Tax=Tetrahymena thermophila (strain SB210) TaxID=312017 RepID=Q22V62_TETTS|nr:cyclic nucleotide-binding domain protein [Tetrahymena thermophila SB210]EAR89086.2 cyclic nucleotide-binding domain protein [Tetrahymena thermophila SB210]|eukprot:XP_001009331.2 cyclic nucleotide-binding domain protein [Tetrahymena thermophila SB210]
MPSLSLQHSQSENSEQNQQNISIQLPSHNFSKYKKISSSRNIQQLQNSKQIKRKFSCQQQLIKSRTFLTPKQPKDEDSPQIPESYYSKTIILSQKQIDSSNLEAIRQPSITCITQINCENKLTDSVSLQNSRSSYTQNSPQSPFLISNFKAFESLASDSIQESQSRKQDNFNLLLSTNSQNNNGILDIPISTSHKNINKIDEIISNKASQLLLMIPNEIKANEAISENKKAKKYFDQQTEIHSCNLKPVILKTQSSSNGQNVFQFTNEQDINKSQNQKKTNQDKQNDINQMTDSFYKTLRINYFNKFKSQNIQNLKKHIQSSLINKMPDSFIPLDKGDLSLYQKKEKCDFEQQKDQFIKWFNQEMYKDRQFQRIQSQIQRKQKELNKQEKPQENFDQIIFSKTQEGFNNSRIHSKETMNTTSLRQKNRNVFNIQVQTQFTEENFQSNLDTSGTRKPSLQKTKSESSQMQVKPYKSALVSRESSQEITSPSSAFKKLSIKKEQESNPFKANSIQSVYQKHLIKQDYKVKNKNSTDGFQTERMVQVLKSNCLKNTFAKTDYDFFLNKECHISSDNRQIFKPRMQELKKFKKPQSQNSLRQLYQQNNSILQIDTSLNQKVQKESSKTQESYSQKLSNMLTYSKSPVSLKSFQNLSVKNQQIKLINPNYYNQNTQNTNNSTLSQEYNSFNFFKKSCERKILSKFEQEIFDPYKMSQNKNIA